MKEMLFRLGQVIWWFGALGAFGAAAAAIFIPNLDKKVLIVGVVWGLVTLPSWALAYVLCGTLGPPKRMP
ncbi:hypothetical protein ASE08_24095 [Rhizobacter sp. Root16D2]|nr:hypothetical protein ASC88_23795 [Rhizobacter sp. Root29]KQW06083.1 hypothetical protein ASC98_26205 [Rhizobacter sp. Root1238]KRB19438.1 hypothetical protein ASE08_24095 [Rhizobacter sp. Root16D2]